MDALREQKHLKLLGGLKEDLKVPGSPAWCPGTPQLTEPRSPNHSLMTDPVWEGRTVSYRGTQHEEAVGTATLTMEGKHLFKREFRADVSIEHKEGCRIT